MTGRRGRIVRNKRGKVVFERRGEGEGKPDELNIRETVSTCVIVSRCNSVNSTNFIREAVSTCAVCVICYFSKSLSLRKLTFEHHVFYALLILVKRPAPVRFPTISENVSYGKYDIIRESELNFPFFVKE